MPIRKSPGNAGRYEPPEPPDDLLPAQLGLVATGRVTLGHLGATLVHLAQRGHLAVAELRPPGRPRDWRMTRLTKPAALAPYEETLLAGLLPTGERDLSTLGTSGAPLESVRTRLVADAVHRGDLHPDSGRRTPAGERLVPVITAYRDELHRLRLIAGEPALAPCWPYAVLFGLDTGRAERSLPAATARERLADFAASWVEAIARLH